MSESIASAALLLLSIVPLSVSALPEISRRADPLFVPLSVTPARFKLAISLVTIVLEERAVASKITTSPLTGATFQAQLVAVLNFPSPPLPVHARLAAWATGLKTTNNDDRLSAAEETTYAKRRSFIYSPFIFCFLLFKVLLP